jgi:hypothetical protein
MNIFFTVGGPPLLRTQLWFGMRSAHAKGAAGPVRRPCRPALRSAIDTDKVSGSPELAQPARFRLSHWYS